MLLLKVIASFGELISYFPSHLNVFCFNLSTPSMFIPLDEKTSRSFLLKSFPIAPVILTLLDRYEEDIAKNCCYLISDDAQRISGQIISIDGNTFRMD